ncbi:MAG TPA: hypothetical protein VKF32_09955 [Thermoanaerobaculia bacterium]|nr:hypothetical protein [Thermoanaerobaculia bacterium]
MTLSAALLTAFPAVSGGFASGPKLVGSGAVPLSWQGYAVALSANGGTAIVGGTHDGSFDGAVWFFVRNLGVWTQQGGKKVGTGAVGGAQQGFSVAISGDGSTAILGGPEDSSSAGAAWVFIRSLNVWTQQGAKLVGTGADGLAGQGHSVALSSDGNTALVGGKGDGSSDGAFWIFTRSGGVWTQQGGKLAGAGAVGAAQQGSSVALSSDGNTAIIGGPFDGGTVGAAWVFTRSLNVWTQQGSKLVGTGAVGSARQGTSVALSSDGNTALVGGPHDDSSAGAAWVFTRSGSTWTQQGGKLVGSGATGTALQGAVSLSGDGDTALVGGNQDNSGFGATWVFTRSGSTWAQAGGKMVGTGASGVMPAQGYSVSLSADGDTALVGGIGDDSELGAAWIFNRLCLHGDVNGDGAVDVVDVFYLINFLFAGGAAPACF